MKIKSKWGPWEKMPGNSTAKHYMGPGSGWPGRRTGRGLGSEHGAGTGHGARTGRVAEGVLGEEDQGTARDAEEDQGTESE